MVKGSYISNNWVTTVIGCTAENTQLRLWVFVLVLGCIAFNFAVALVDPIAFWDMLGYAASVYSLSESDPAVIHTAVFTELKEYVSPAVYMDLTAGSEYRAVLTSDPAGFYQQIPFYKIRYLYVLILYALVKLGFSVFYAINILSAVFNSAALLVLFLGLRNHLHSLFWVIMPLAYYGITTDLTVIRAGGVDAFAFFWVSLTIVAFVRGHRLLLPLIAMSVLIRTNLIIHAALMFGVLLLMDRPNWRNIVLWGVACLMMYVAVNVWVGNYGWSTLIYFVFVSEMSATHPETYTNYTFTAKEYVHFVLNNKEWVSNWFWFTLGCGILSVALFLTTSSFGKKAVPKSYFVVKQLNIVVAVFLVYILLHYLLFPTIFMRFFTGQCMLLVISFFATVSHMYLAERVTASQQTKPI